MQDPNADTEWNDILRKKGILPPKEKPKEEEEEEIPQDDGKKYGDMTLDELDEFEDEEDERVMEMYRQKRIAEIKALQSKNKFGDVREISAVDYVQQVNNAGDGIWVVLHLFKQGIPLCTLINDFLRQLAPKFPQVKFLNSVSTTCIPNYPDKNLPTIFVYKDGDMKESWIGPHTFGGMNLKVDDLEWKLHKAGVVESTLEEDPRPKVHDMMMSSIRVSNTKNKHDDSESSDEDY